MNATRQTATIFPAEMMPSVARSYGAARFVRRPRSSFGETNGATVPERTVSVNEVCDLIRSAGPLPLRDIAGGLNAPEQRVSSVVTQMIAENLLGEDEWGRYRVCGACR